MTDGAPLPVHAQNFVRAETDTYFSKIAASQGTGRWSHTREPAPVDAQTVIRLNRDTLYSAALVDLSAGATLTMPEVGGRYQTAMIVNRDHFVNAVHTRPGSHRLDAERLGSDFVVVAVRTLVDPLDPDDVARAHAAQDGLALEAGSSRAFRHPPWDGETLSSTRETLLRLAAGVPDLSHAFGTREETEPVAHLLGTAAGWGGLPRREAVYEGVDPGLPVGHYRIVVGDVPVEAFWSVSVYNRDGYFEPNPFDRYSVNSITAVRDADGTVTVNLGGDPGLPNQIPLPEGWNYLVRLYRPRAEILEGRWRFPACEPA